MLKKLMWLFAFGIAVATVALVVHGPVEAHPDDEWHVYVNTDCFEQTQNGFVDWHAFAERIGDTEGRCTETDVTDEGGHAILNMWAEISETLCNQDTFQYRIFAWKDLGGGDTAWTDTVIKYWSELGD